MSENHSDKATDPEIEDLRRTVASVRRMTREFDNLTAWRRMENAELAVLSEDLRRAGGNGPLTPHPALAGAFQEVEQSMARLKALRKEICQAASNYAQELIRRAEALKERQSRRNLQDAGQQVVRNPANVEPEGKGLESVSITVGLLAKRVEELAAPLVKELTLSSEIAPKADLAAESVVSIPVAALGFFFASGSTAGPEPDVSQSNPQRGLILNPGERRGQDGTIYTSDGQIAVYANGTSALSKEERLAISHQGGSTADLLRNVSGTVTITEKLTPASGNWLDPKKPAPIPAQVAAQLVGRKFNSFSEFRAAFWQAVAASPDLGIHFTAANLANMRAGYAPLAPAAFQVNTSAAGSRFNLHHIVPVEVGGSLYDLGNIQIVSPAVHGTLHNIKKNQHG